MVTDPISNFIISIKNGSDAGKTTIVVPYSALKESIAHVLAKGGYLSTIEKKGKKAIKTLEIGLVYLGDEPRVHGVDRISKPSRRIYQKANDIRMFKSGFGNTVISTPKGVLLDIDAKKNKVGGEVLFKIW
ncbi:MAG: 30S ribosomal protein S8 [bacterium]|nr:30S ribosomal protein S8 [bacterium]